MQGAGLRHLARGYGGAGVLGADAVARVVKGGKVGDGKREFACVGQRGQGGKVARAGAGESGVTQAGDQRAGADGKAERVFRQGGIEGGKGGLGRARKAPGPGGVGRADVGIRRFDQEGGVETVLLDRRGAEVVVA